MEFIQKKLGTRIHSHHILLSIFLVYIILFFCHALLLKKTVYGDGIYYYSWVRSIVIDHDISFVNEYSHLGGIQPTTPLHLTGNVYPIGPALLWLPFFIVIQNVLRGDGFTFIYQLWIGFISCLFSISGLIFLYRLLKKFFSEEVSTLTMLGIALGTNLLFYGSIDTVNSHSASFFISVLLVTFILENRSFFLVGFFAGLLSLMRTQDAIFLLLAFPSLLENKKKLSSIFSLLFSFFLAFLPQLIAWQLLYGTVTKSPYLDPYHTFNFLHPQLFNVLFSPNNGLFLWTPLVAICILGLFLQSTISKNLRISFIALFIIQWFLIASWSFWWQGESFSGRIFISLLPILAFGLGNILKRHSALKNTIFFAFSIMNVCLILLYLFTH